MAAAAATNRETELPGLKKSRSRSAFEAAEGSPNSHGTAAPLTPEPVDSAAHQGRLDAALQSVMDEMDDVPFNEICHTGATWTRKNWLIKLWRYLIVPTKELYLPFMTAKLPTNYLMLTFRTFNRDYSNPNHNEDFLAARLRDALMPSRGRLHREKSPWLRYKTQLLDTPYLGIPGIVNFIDVRTQWFDEGVKRAIEDGFKQVVIIAAGYDTRAYRLGKPGVRFYEVDLPHASKLKQKLVADLLPQNEFPWPEFVGADLSKATLMEALSGTTFDKTQKTMYIIEGLVYYLPPLAFKRQLTCISETAVVGSRLYFDFLHLSTLSGDKFHPGFETLMVSVWNKGEHMYSGVDERPEAINCLLKKFGFKLTEALDAKAIQGRYLTHLEWKDNQPPVSPYFGYIAAEKIMAPIKRMDTFEKQQAKQAKKQL